MMFFFLRTDCGPVFFLSLPPSCSPSLSQQHDQIFFPQVRSKPAAPPPLSAEAHHSLFLSPISDPTTIATIKHSSMFFLNPPIHPFSVPTPPPENLARFFQESTSRPKEGGKKGAFFPPFYFRFSFKNRNPFPFFEGASADNAFPPSGLFLLLFIATSFLSSSRQAKLPSPPPLLPH